LNYKKNENNIWKVKNIKYDNSKEIYDCRLYNEYNTDANFALYNETTLKLHELIEKFNFKVYYFKTKPSTNLKISLKKRNCIDVLDKDVKKIKFLQSNDFYYLYMNLFFEVFYFFPHIDSNNNYSYNFIVVVNQNFNIDKISKHNFNLVNIINFIELKKSDINFSFIEEIFENRTIIYNNTCDEGELWYSYDDLPSEKEYFDFYGKEKLNLNFEQITNLKRIKHNRFFNQNLYCQFYFKLLCTHIISFGGEHYIEENKSGKTYARDDIYELNSMFFTNFHDIVDSKTVSIEDAIVTIKGSDYYGTCIWDNIYDQYISSVELSKEFVLNGFINFDNKKIVRNF